MMDWLLPLRDGDDNPEALYAVRSWVEHAGLGSSDRLVTVGYCPSWLIPDLHLPGNDHRTGPINVYANVRDACASGELGGWAIVANDDMFAMRPTDPAVIAYRCTLRDHVRRLEPGWWRSSLQLTSAYLRKNGVPEPLSYELHRPLLVETAVMGRVLTEAWSGHGIPVQWRTVYSNLAQIGGEQAEDGKVIRRPGVPEVDWISTTDGSWRTHEVGRVVRERFVTPTRFERMVNGPADERTHP